VYIADLDAFAHATLLLCHDDERIAVLEVVWNIAGGH
jgi:hypothetical protein